MADKIRLSDVAQQAGVSTATVSRVINGKSTVAPATRQAVLTALDLLGYERPEKLRVRPGGLVGLVVPELTNPIFPVFAQEIESSLSTSGYTPLLCTQTAGGITEDQYVSLLLDQHVAGIIFVSGLHADTAADPSRYLRLEDRGIPYVTINGSNPEIPAPDFSADDADAVEQAVRHLVDSGHRRIGMCTGPRRFRTSQEKVLGYQRAMAKYLPEENEHISYNLYTVEGGQAGAAELIDEGCTAIVCGSDIMALGGIRHARSLGLGVPEDVSFVGFDDSSLMPFCDPPLTTMSQPVAPMCQAAVTTLIAMIEGTSVSRTPLKFRADLIVRRSTSSAK